MKLIVRKSKQTCTGLTSRLAPGPATYFCVSQDNVLRFLDLMLPNSLSQCSFSANGGGPDMLSSFFPDFADGARFARNYPVPEGSPRMPWFAEDAERHTHKASTLELQELWAKVANECLERTGDEGRAIREANAVIARQVEVGDENAARSRKFT